MLDGDIGRQTHRANDARHRRHVDNHAPALLEHLLQLVLHARPGARQVDGNHAVPLLTLDAMERARRVAIARIVEGIVETTIPLDGRSHQRLDRHLVTDIHGHKKAVAPRRADGLHRLLALHLTPSAHYHPRASARKRHRCRATNPRCRACHQSHFTLHTYLR